MLISLVSCYGIFNGHFVLVVFMFYCFNTFVSVFRAVVSALALLVLSTVLYHCFCIVCFRRIKMMMMMMTMKDCHYRPLIGSDIRSIATAAVSMTLSDLKGQGHAPNADLLECNFSYSCATVDEISADTGRRAVPLRQPNLLSDECRKLRPALQRLAV